MYPIQNKQYNLRQIAAVEWVEEPIVADDPVTGLPSNWYGYRIYLGGGVVDAMLHKTQEECRERWEALIDTMEKAGL